MANELVMGNIEMSTILEVTRNYDEDDKFYLFHPVCFDNFVPGNVYYFLTNEGEFTATEIELEDHEVGVFTCWHCGNPIN